MVRRSPRRGISKREIARRARKGMEPETFPDVFEMKAGKGGREPKFQDPQPEFRHMRLRLRSGDKTTTHYAYSERRQPKRKKR
jgi:hypothetical protein